MQLLKKPKDALLHSLQTVIHSELMRAITLFEYPSPAPDAEEIRKHVYVRSSEKNGKSISKFYWRNRLILIMNDPAFKNGGSRLEVRFVRFLERSRIITSRLEYDSKEKKVRKFLDLGARRRVSDYGEG